MSSSVEPKKVGSSRDDPKCVAKTTHHETKTSTTDDHTSKLASTLAKVEKLFADLRAYFRDQFMVDFTGGEDVIKKILNNYFATPKPTSHTANGYGWAVEFCNQLEGWLAAFHAFDTDCKNNPGYICYGYRSALIALTDFEFRSFGSNYECAYVLRDMMSRYNDRILFAPLKGDRNKYVASVLHDAIVFLCDRLSYFIVWWTLHEHDF